MTKPEISVPETAEIPREPEYVFSQKIGKEINDFYSDYSKSLGETTRDDIRNIVDNITSDTKYTKLEVLDAMQHITQFANMRSVLHIGDELRKRNVYAISDCEGQVELNSNELIYSTQKSIREAFSGDFGLNSALNYLISAKKLGNIKKYNEGENVAIFLDENKLKLLEESEADSPIEFKRFIANKKLKFFILSGSETGITFVDRTKDLEKETRKILDLADRLNVPVEEAVDYDIRKRAKKIGITPIELKNEGMPTINCVYTQMAPEKMSKQDLYNIIKINTMKRNKNNSPIEKEAIEEATVNYLKKSLTVYTPETFSKALKNLHTMVLDYAKEKGKTEEDIIYVLPKHSKSHKAVSCFYSKINNIPASQFVHINRVRNDKSKLYVIIDDCTLTGASTNSISNHMNCTMQGNTTDTLFAYVCGTDYAKTHFDKQDNTDMIFYDKINTDIDEENSSLSRAVGHTSYDEIITCLSLPYMAPDNNSDFGANIAMLHNPVYRSFNHSQMTRQDKIGYGIKNYQDITKEIIEEYYKNIGINPKIEEPVKKENNGFLSKIFKPAKKS